MSLNPRNYIEDRIFNDKTHTVYYKNEESGTVVFIQKEANIAIGFKRKSTKISFNYNFNSKEYMLSYIDKFIETDKQEQAEKKKRADERKAFVPDFEIGDIFVGSWGYDQTNNNFYQVIAKNKKKATVRELKQKNEYFKQMSLAGKAYPLPNEFYGDEELVRIVQLGNRIKINSFISARIIKPIAKDEKGQPIYEGLYFSQTA